MGIQRALGSVLGSDFQVQLEMRIRTQYRAASPISLPLSFRRVVEESLVPASRPEYRLVFLKFHPLYHSSSPPTDRKNHLPLPIRSQSARHCAGS